MPFQCEICTGSSPSCEIDWNEGNIGRIVQGCKGDEEEEKEREKKMMIIDQEDDYG